MYRNYIVLCGLVLLIAACSPQKRANWHLKRAKRLNPVLLDSIRTVVSYKDSIASGTLVDVIVPEDSAEFTDNTPVFNPCDSNPVLPPVNKNIAFFPKSNRIEFSDSNFKVVVYNENGNIRIKVNTKERSKQAVLNKPIVRWLNVPCNCPPSIIVSPYTWKDKVLIFLGWSLLGLIVIGFVVWAFIPLLKGKSSK